MGIGSFSTVSDTIQNQMRTIYEEPLPKNASRSHGLLKTLYNLCSNSTANDKEGVKNAQEYFDRLGGWPVLKGDRWNENNFEWNKLVHKIREIGGMHHFFIAVGLCVPLNQTVRFICIDEIPFRLPNDFLTDFNNNVTQAVYNYTVDIAVMFGANKINAMSEMKDVMEFSLKLSHILQGFKNITKSSNFTTIKQLQKEFPSLAETEYIQNALQVPDANITEDEKVLLRVPLYVKELLVLLEETPKRTQANYMFMENADSIIPFLSDNLKLRRAAFYKLFDLDYSSKSVAADCRLVCSMYLRLQVDHLYVTRFFNKTVKEQAQKFIGDIRKQFVESLKHVEWFDNQTRTHAIEKVLGMKEYIGYPSELLESKNVDAYYEKLVINSTNYLTAMLSVKKFLQNQEYFRLRQPLNMYRWYSHSFPLTVNAYYAMCENSINFPAGILQGAFYNENRPNYLNYGILGFIVAHEITHGFDNHGRLVDKNGNVSNWWSNRTTEYYKNKSQCIIDQYNNYTYKEFNVTVNGTATVDENIADNVALKESYYAYNQWIKKHGPEPQLPGLEYTPKQLFWIASAQLWCSKDTHDFAQRMMKRDPHAPPEFRVIGAFSNSENFTKDFKCSVNSSMNRKNKCSLW